MTGKDITIEMVKKNNYVKGAIVCFCIFVALALVDAGVFIYLGANNALSGSNSEAMGLIGMLSGFVAVVWIMFLIFGGIGLYGRVKINKFLNENGEENVMSEINNNTIYVLAHKKKVISIITDKHIIEIARGVFKSTDIDYAYGYRYRNSTSIRAFDINNKAFGFANGINLNADEKFEVFEALKRINPNILLGYSADNYKEHKARVKAHKKGL